MRGEPHQKQQITFPKVVQQQYVGEVDKSRPTPWSQLGGMGNTEPSRQMVLVPSEVKSRPRINAQFKNNLNANVPNF